MESLLPSTEGLQVQIEQVGGMNASVLQTGGSSLLPDATAHIEQVGGGVCLSGKCMKYGWYSTPLFLSASLQHPPYATAKDFKILSNFWKSICVNKYLIATIDCLESEVYIVAPLRGDYNAAKDVISWATSKITESNTFIIFHGSLRAGGKEKDGDMIESMICFLMSKYPSRILCVNCQDSGPSVHNLQGILLHALPHTSRRLFLGALPDPRIVDDTHEIQEEGVLFESIDVNRQFRKQHTQDMFEINFKKPKTLYNREKEPKPQDIRNNKLWASPPGWITRIEFERRNTDIGQKGGARNEIGFTNFKKLQGGEYDNAHNRCYMNAALQLFLSLEPFVDAIQNNIQHIRSDVSQSIVLNSLIEQKITIHRQEQIFFKLILDTLKSLINFFTTDNHGTLTRYVTKDIVDTTNIPVRTNVLFSTAQTLNNEKEVINPNIQIGTEVSKEEITVYDVFKLIMRNKERKEKIPGTTTYKNIYNDDSQQDSSVFLFGILDMFQHVTIFRDIINQIFFIEKEFNVTTQEFTNSTVLNSYLNLPIVGKTIQTCIDDYIKTKEREGFHEGNIQTQFEFNSEFRYLIILLKRFSYNKNVASPNASAIGGGGSENNSDPELQQALKNSLQDEKTQKLNTAIEMDKKITIPGINNTEFKGELIGCIEHMGNTSKSGHYVYTKFNGNIATRYNDDEIREIQNYDFTKNTTCYILLYKKQEDSSLVGGVTPEVPGEPPGLRLRNAGQPTPGLTLRKTQGNAGQPTLGLTLRRTQGHAEPAALAVPAVVPAVLAAEEAAAAKKATEKAAVPAAAGAGAAEEAAAAKKATEKATEKTAGAGAAGAGAAGGEEAAAKKAVPAAAVPVAVPGAVPAVPAAVPAAEKAAVPAVPVVPAAVPVVPAAAGAGAAAEEAAAEEAAVPAAVPAAVVPAGAAPILSPKGYARLNAAKEAGKTAATAVREAAKTAGAAITTAAGATAGVITHAARTAGAAIKKTANTFKDKFTKGKGGDGGKEDEEDEDEDCPKVGPIKLPAPLLQWLQQANIDKKDFEKEILYKIPKNLLQQIEKGACFEEIEFELAPCCENVRAFIWSYYLDLLDKRQKKRDLL